MAFLSQKGHLFNTANSFLHDRKFDTAIRLSSIQRFVKDKYNPSFSDKLIWHHHPNADNFLQDTSLLPQLIIGVLKGTTSSRCSNAIDQSRVFSVTREVTNFQVAHLLSGTYLTNLTHVTKEWDKILQLLSTQPEVSRLLNAIVELDEAIEHLPLINQYYPEDITESDRHNRKVDCNTYEIPYLNLKITWSYTMCVVQFMGESWILPRPFILQIKAKLADILSVLLYSHLASFGPLDSDAYKTTLDFIIEYCRLHIRRPKKFFTLAAALEGLVVSIILKRGESWVNEDLWKTLKKEIDDALQINLESEPFYTILNNASIPLLAELGCLSKVTGHPLVDIAEGSKKLYDRVQEDFLVNINAIADCINYLKENYVYNFIARYHRWPNISFTDLAHPLLLACHAANVSPKTESFIKQHGSIRLQDWSSVNLESENMFQRYENILGFMADKAISVNQSQAFQTYMQHKRPPTKDTRLLLFYLYNDEAATDHMRYLDKYTKAQGDLDTLVDYLVIRVVPKEKELKTAFRGFGCKTFLDRTRSIIQERNAMTYLQLFSDEQALSLDELTLTRKIYSFLKLNEVYKDHRIFYINFDASGWNNKFRDMTVRPVCRETIDPVMGVEFWQWTQSGYEHTLYIIPDENFMIWWKGQKGGIEGLSQGTWQLVYAGQMKKALAKSDYKYHVVNKGDDYRAGICIPTIIIDEEDAGRLAERLRDEVCDAAREFGHEIKMQESYVSEKLFTFSKSMYFDQIPLSYSFRKIQKTHGETNTFMPFLDDYVASIFSNAHSSCASTSVHIPQFVIAVFWMLRYLIKHPIHSKLTNIELGALCCIPSVVGGFPIILLNNFLVRAESDLLSSFVTLYKYSEKINHPYTQIFYRFLTIQRDHKASLSMLLGDPYCLPIRKPRSPASKLKTIICRKLRYSPIKPEIKELLQLIDSSKTEELVSVLSTSKKWWAKLFSALYDSTPMSLAHKFVSQFLSSKSIMDTLLVTKTSRRRAEKLIKDCMNQDRELNVWRSSVVKGLIISDPRPYIKQEKCPTKITQMLRDDMWRREVVTVTHPSLTHQIIVTNEEYYRIYPSSLQEHFTLTIDKNPKDPLQLNNCHYTKGKYEPFLGHRTSPGTISPSVRIMESDPTSNSVLNLVMLHNYTHCAAVENDTLKVSNFPNLIDRILPSLTNLSVSQLSPFSSVRKSGTQTHRLRSHGFNESIVPNSNSTLYSRCVGETNTHRLFRESTEDFTVNFLHILCYGIVMSQFDSQGQKTTNVPPEVWLVTNPCTYCTQPIDEPIIDLSSSAIDSYIPPQLKLTKMAASSEPILERAMDDFYKKHTILEQSPELNLSFQTCSYAICYYWIWNTWNKDDSIVTRYGLHRGSSSQVALASSLLGGQTKNPVGETELRLIHSNVFIDCLSVFVTSFLIQHRYCFQVSEISNLLSTIHAESIPWYPIIAQLIRYGCLPSILIQLQEISGVDIPSDATVRIESTIKYITPILYDHCINSLLNKNFLEFPYFHEYSVEVYYNMIQVFIPLCRYKAACYLNEGLESPDEDICQMSYYFTITSPKINIMDFKANHNEDPHKEIEFFSTKDYNVQRDMLAIDQAHHPQYHLVKWASLSTGSKLRDILCGLDRETIQEFCEEFDTRVLIIKPTWVGLAQSCDILRSQRRGAEDIFEDNLLDDVSIVNLEPRVRLSPIYHEIIPDISSLPPTSIVPPLPAQLICPTYQDYNYLYHSYGVTDPAGSVISHLLVSLKISPNHFRLVTHSAVINDEDYGVSFMLLHLSPTTKIEQHMLASAGPVIPRLLKTDKLPPDYNEDQILRSTLRHAPSSPSSEIFWECFLSELSVYPQIIIHRINIKETMNEIWNQMINLVRALNTDRKKQTLIIIETYKMFLVKYGGLISYLSYLCYSVSIVKVPSDIHYNRYWIVCYGHRRTDANLSFSLVPHPNPQITLRLHDLFHRFENSCISPSQFYINQHLSCVTINNRLSNMCRYLSSNIKDVISNMLKFAVIGYPNSNNARELLSKLRFQINSELLAKNMDFKSGSEVGGRQADRTLRHKLEIFRRIISLEYLMTNINKLTLEHDSIIDCIKDIVTPQKFWEELIRLGTREGWILDKPYYIHKGHYTLNIKKNLFIMFGAVLRLVGHLYLILKINEM